MSEDLTGLSSAELEAMLLRASELPGRKAMARVTAIRTLLARRPREQLETEAENRHARALALVNACRPADDQVTEVHATWVESILADEGWAELYAADHDLRSGMGRDQLRNPASGADNHRRRR